MAFCILSSPQSRAELNEVDTLNRRIEELVREKKFSEAAPLAAAGGTTGQMLSRLMDREGVRSLAILSSEETREDFTVLEETTGQQYRFVLPGAPLSEGELRECLHVFEFMKPYPKFVVVSGSLLPGAPEDFFSKVIRAAKKLSARVILDTSGVPLKVALNEGVYLIKPNLREFHELTGMNSADETKLVNAGRSLIDRGLVEFIALTLGAQGALLIARDRVLRAKGLPIKPASVVGAGDSFLGAMVWSLARNSALEAALRYAIAAGSAALLKPGTELCQLEDVNHLAPQVIITSRP